MKPTNLRVLIVATLLAVQMATVILFLLNAKHYTTNQFGKNAQAALIDLAAKVSDQTQRFLEPAENVLLVGRQLIANGLLDASSDQNLVLFFEAQLLSSSWLKGIYLGRSDGSFIWVNRQADGLRTKRVEVSDTDRTVTLNYHEDSFGRLRNRIDSEDMYDPRIRPWYKQARMADTISWTNAYQFFASRLPGISASVPVYVRGLSDAGVLGVDVDIQAFSAFLSTIPNARNGSSAIIDGNKNVIAFSDTDWLASVNVSGGLPSLGDVVGTPLLKLFDQSSIKHNSASADVIKQFRVSGVEHLGYSRPISVSQGRVNWLLLIQSPTEDYLGGVSEFFSEGLLILIFALLITFILSLAVVCRLTKPVFRIHQDATIDRLTGALTRNELRRKLTIMLNDRRRVENAGQVVVVALDLDKFKQVNDNFGHSVGDQVLAEFSCRLRNRLRESDLFGRVGGDEFIFVVRLNHSADILQTIDQIRGTTVSEPINSSVALHTIGVTAGVAVHEVPETLTSLLTRADQALISGKKCKKNCSYMAIDCEKSKLKVA